jgi:hypothetical protein
MAEANPQIADPSGPDVRISDLITGRIFAAASLYAASECAHGRGPTGTAEICAFCPPPLDISLHSPKRRAIIKPSVRPP